MGSSYRSVFFLFLHSTLPENVSNRFSSTRLQAVRRVTYRIRGCRSLSFFIPTEGISCTFDQSRFEEFIHFIKMKQKVHDDENDKGIRSTSFIALSTLESVLKQHRSISLFLTHIHVHRHVDDGSAGCRSEGSIGNCLVSSLFIC